MIRTVAATALLLLGAACSTPGPAQEEARPPLRVASDLDNWPFAAVDDAGRPIGRDVEMADGADRNLCMAQKELICLGGAQFELEKYSGGLMCSLPMLCRCRGCGQCAGNGTTFERKRKSGETTSLFLFMYPSGIAHLIGRIPRRT